MKLPSEIAKKACQVMTNDCIGQKFRALYDHEIIEIEESERALIERAEKAEANLSNYESMKMTNEAMSKKLLELEAQIPKWIPVSERLPDGKDEILISNGRYVSYAYFVEGRWYYAEESQYPYEYKDVTHWMPMPLPPTE